MELKVGLRQLVALFALVFATILTGCGGGTSTNSNSSSQSASAQAAAVSISFQPAPATSAFINARPQFTAVVKNDPNNYGVDWCVAAPGQPCGQPCNGVCGGDVNIHHTQSGEAVTYTPPATVPGNRLTVDIIAFATADHTRNVVTPITITGFDGTVSGTYVFQASGGRINTATLLGEKPYQIAGVVNFDGNGGISLVNLNGQTVGGEQTYSGPSGFGSAHITGGSYVLGADGRGTFTISTDDPTIGVKGSETFSMVSISSSQLEIAQVDGTASAVGSMELQSTPAAPTGGYAFTAIGTDPAGLPAAFGGILNIDQPNGGVSGHGSVADQQYHGALQSCQGQSASGGSAGISGVVGAADSFGAVQLSVTACFAAKPLQFTGYMVDGKHIKLIETDLDPKLNTGFATAGVALGQGTATGTFSGSQSLTGDYVFGIKGFNSSGSASSLNLAGALASSGAGTLSGSSDEIAVNGPVITDGFSGNYTFDAAGTGRIDVPIVFGQANNASLSAPELIFYLSGNGAPALVLDSDPTAQAVATGIAFPQAVPPLPFGGEFGFAWSVLNQTANGSTTSDETGDMTVDPVAGQLTGFADGPGFVGQDAALTTGTITPLATTTGRFSGSLTYQSLGGVQTAPVDYYLADTNHGFVIENDGNALLLGFFAARAPVCPTCP
jgi:hypothetical protein